jgi:hypothetical protein
MPLAQETHGLSCSTTLVSVARIGDPLLLKTILPRPAAATGGSDWMNLFQYSGDRGWKQRRRLQPVVTRVTTIANLTGQNRASQLFRTCSASGSFTEISQMHL